MGLFRRVRERVRPGFVSRAGRSVLVLVLLGGAWQGPGGLAAQTTLVEPSPPLLPQQFAGWTRAGEPAEAQATPSLLNDPKASAVFREDGLLRSATATYSHSGHPGTLSVVAAQFTDATGAVAAYTYFHQREMADAPSESGARNHTNIAHGAGRTLLREGTTLVLLDEAGGATAPGESAVRNLAATLPKVGGPRGLPPLLPTYLPAQDFVPGSMEYAVGPAAYVAEGGLLPPELLGFAKAAEVATAEYSSKAGGSGPGKLTLVLLPTPEIAGDRGRAVQDWLNSPAGRAAGLGTPRLRRVGPLLVLATGLPAAEAASLVNDVHLRTEVTWNKPVPPEFHTEIRKTASLLTSILILSGVLGLAAVLLGLFLGFGRAWVRVLMGKPAATEPEFLRLDLRQGASREADRVVGK